MLLARLNGKLTLAIAALGASLAFLTLLFAPDSGVRTVVLAVAAVLALLPLALRAARVHSYGDVQVGVLVLLFGAAAFSYDWFEVGPSGPLSGLECVVAVALAGALGGAAFGRSTAAWSAMLVAGMTLAQRHYDLPLIGTDSAGLIAFAILALPIGAALGALLPGGALRAMGAAALILVGVSVFQAQPDGRTDEARAPVVVDSVSGR